MRKAIRFYSIKSCNLASPEHGFVRYYRPTFFDVKVGLRSRLPQVKHFGVRYCFYTSLSERGLLTTKSGVATYPDQEYLDNTLQRICFSTPPFALQCSEIFVNLLLCASPSQYHLTWWCKATLMEGGMERRVNKRYVLLHLWYG